ncbi:hypothetical protein [Rhizorhapis sp. SPR117]|uniref:hypothetical protein n=1 Tax=Rhizorhapis sp. SPR117 TaxID=2912611 RepID=UPI001F448B6F|nr:hypothetical protein [Rhizorhapis sp. SPR117]
MASAPIIDSALKAAAEEAAHDLVSVRHWGDASFVSLPLINPDGSSSTVRIKRAPGGFQVDDAGFTYRDLKRAGADRSFSRAASKAAERDDLQVDNKVISVRVTADELARAISDVGLAAWSVLDTVYERLNAEEAEIAESLRERLLKIFAASVDEAKSIPGMSTNPWEVTGIVRQGEHVAVFQAVANHANSVYRASAAFHDLAALPVPPTLISVVRDRKALGAKLSLLAQAGRVIEYDQADDVFMRAAA